MQVQGYLGAAKTHSPGSTLQCSAHIFVHSIHPGPWRSAAAGKRRHAACFYCNRPLVLGPAVLKGCSSPHRRLHAQNSNLWSKRRTEGGSG